MKDTKPLPFILDDEVIEALISLNPYPVDIFPEPDPDEIARASSILLNNGINSTRVFAKIGRTSWINCVRSLKIFMDLTP
jgi:hypothetical protein